MDPAPKPVLGPGRLFGTYLVELGYERGWWQVRHPVPPSRSPHLVQALDVLDAESMFGPEVLKPRDHPFQPHHPHPWLSCAAPPPGLYVGGKGAADSNLHGPGIARHYIPHPVCHTADHRHVAPTWLTTERPQREHSGLAKQHERDAMPSEQHVALDEPAVGRQASTTGASRSSSTTTRRLLSRCWPSNSSVSGEYRGPGFAGGAPVDASATGACRSGRFAGVPPDAPGSPPRRSRWPGATCACVPDASARPRQNRARIRAWAAFLRSQANRPRTMPEDPDRAAMASVRRSSRARAPQATAPIRTTSPATSSSVESARVVSGGEQHRLQPGSPASATACCPDILRADFATLSCWCERAPVTHVVAIQPSRCRESAAPQRRRAADSSGLLGRVQPLGSDGRDLARLRSRSSSTRAASRSSPGLTRCRYCSTACLLTCTVCGVGACDSLVVMAQTVAPASAPVQPAPPAYTRIDAVCVDLSRAHRSPDCDRRRWRHVPTPPATRCCGCC